MGPQWDRNLGSEVYIPRKQEEDERREIKRIYQQLQIKEGETHIGGGDVRNFGDEIPPRPLNQE